MIKCYAIIQWDNFDALNEYCLKYPLTMLVGHHQEGTFKPNELLDLGVQVIFVDYQLKQKFKRQLEKLSEQVSIIYLSGNAGHAHEAFEDGALDYLTYPFSFARFERSINKLVRFSLMLPQQTRKKEVEVLDSFFVKPDPKGKTELLINCAEILFIEAFQNDVVIQMNDGRKFVCYHTMREMEDYLSSCFMRVHKSFIINYKKILAFDGSAITLEGIEQNPIPLGGAYKKVFFDRRNSMVIRKSNREFNNPTLAKALNYITLYYTLDFGIFAEGLFI